METFARIITALAAVFIVLMIFERYLEIDRLRNDNAESRIRTIYGNIKEKGFISATDMLELKEAASLCRGSISVSAGCRRDDVGEDGSVHFYREYLYAKEIEQLIIEEGSFVLSPGDTLSIKVENVRGSGTLLPWAVRKGALTVGGMI